MYVFGALESVAFAALFLWLFLQYPQIGVMGVIAPLFLLGIGALCTRKARGASS